MKKQQVLFGFLAVWIAGSIIAMVPAYAAESTTKESSFTNSFVSFFSSKFGLEETKVSAAVKEFHEKHKAEMKDQMKVRLNTKLETLVKEGKISDAQKQAILGKLSQLHSKYSKESMKDLTPEERKKRMDEQKAEIEAFAKEQNINIEYILPTGGMKMKRHMFTK